MFYGSKKIKTTRKTNKKSEMLNNSHIDSEIDRSFQ